MDTMKIYISPEEKTILEKKASDLMSAARTQLILQQPFFGSLSMRLKFRPTWNRPTAATDGRRLLYNPRFILTLTRPQIMGIIAHEIMHCALEHHKRRGKRDPKRWNIAGDIVINPLITDAGNGLELTDGALFPAEDEHGLSTEEMYERIKTPPTPPPTEPDPDAAPEDGNGSGSGSGTSDAPEDEKDPKDDPDGTPGPADDPDADEDDEDGEDDDPEEEDDGPEEDGRREVEPDPTMGDVLDDPGPDPDDPDDKDGAPDDWTGSVIAARDFAKGRGNMPHAIDAAITAAIRPTYTLNDLVRAFITDAIRSDYTWRRPNKAYFAHGLRAPSLDIPEPGLVAVFVDVSGSISRDQVRAALNAISGMAEELRAPVRVICCNAGITFDKRFEPGEPVLIPDASGGGTDFGPPFARMAEDPERPSCAIYISADMDGYFPDPESAPDYPVLWISEPLETAPPIPFGEWYGIQTPEGPQ